MVPPSTMPAQPERQRAERHHLGDLERRQPPMRIQPVAHRRPGHRRETQIVRQRIGAERRERDPAVAHLVPGIDRAQPVVERQHAHRTGPSRRTRSTSAVLRDRLQRRLDVGELEVPELLPARHRSRRPAAPRRAAPADAAQPHPLHASAASGRVRGAGRALSSISATVSRNAIQRHEAAEPRPLLLAEQHLIQAARTRPSAPGTDAACRPHRPRPGSPRPSLPGGNAAQRAGKVRKRRPLHRGRARGTASPAARNPGSRRPHGPPAASRNGVVPGAASGL